MTPKIIRKGQTFEISAKFGLGHKSNCFCTFFFNSFFVIFAVDEKNLSTNIIVLNFSQVGKKVEAISQYH